MQLTFQRVRRFHLTNLDALQSKLKSRKLVKVWKSLMKLCFQVTATHLVKLQDSYSERSRIKSTRILSQHLKAQHRQRMATLRLLLVYKLLLPFSMMKMKNHSLYWLARRTLRRYARMQTQTSYQQLKLVRTEWLMVQLVRFLAFRLYVQENLQKAKRSL